MGSEILLLPGGILGMYTGYETLSEVWNPIRQTFEPFIRIGFAIKVFIVPLLGIIAFYLMQHEQRESPMYELS